MTSWHSLFWTSKTKSLGPTETVAVVEGALTTDGFTRYNPFGLLPAPLYPQTVKLFVAPRREVWGRVIAADALPEAVPATLSDDGVVLALRLEDDGTASATVYAGGGVANDPVAALAPHTAPDVEAGLLAAALALPHEVTDADGSNVPLGLLPDHYREMADKLKPKDIEKLFDKMAGGVFRKGGDREAAEGLLRRASGPDWSAGGGAAIRRLLTLLAIPNDWVHPAFVPLRDAYALHARRQRKPQARLYPGDAEAMQAVPDALDYAPLFMGKDA